jgi:hypothetical protein
LREQAKVPTGVTTDLPAESYARIGEVAGMFGGASIGIGVVAMVIGLIKRSKKG